MNYCTKKITANVNPATKELLADSVRSYLMTDGVQLTVLDHHGSGVYHFNDCTLLYERIPGIKYSPAAYAESGWIRISITSRKEHDVEETIENICTTFPEFKLEKQRNYDQDHDLGGGD